MERDVHAVLDAHFETYRIDGQLHDVPPHEVYAVRVDGRRAVCKYDVGPTGRAGIEGRVTAFVGEHASVPVPQVLAVGDDHYVAAWHPDAPAPDHDGAVDERWARAAGRGLATLHDETRAHVDGYGYFERASGDGDVSTGIEGPVAPCDNWHDAVLAYLRRHRDALAAYGCDDVLDDVIEFFRARPAAFAGAGEAVCCHGWATPEHVAVHDGAVACVLDFEHAIAAPGEYDYWRTALPTFDDDTAAARRAFRDGYESVRSLPDGFERRRPYYRLLALAYYLESLHVQSQHDARATAIRERHLVDAIRRDLDALA